LDRFDAKKYKKVQNDAKRQKTGAVSHFLYFGLDFRQPAFKMASETKKEVLTENCYKTCILRHGCRFCLEMRQMNVFVHFFRH